MYDYALTSGQEVELFWRRGPPVSRVLMFCCRLLVLMYVPTTMLATYFLPLYTTVSLFFVPTPLIKRPHPLITDGRVKASRASLICRIPTLNS